MRKHTAARGKTRATGPIRIAVYLRVSTIKQLKGYGLDVQKEACLKKVKERFGNRPVEIVFFQDEGVSGKLDSRPELDVMTQAILGNKYDLVVFGKLDRVGRTFTSILRWINNALDANVGILTADGRLDSSNESFNLIVGLLAHFAELEHSLILERTFGGRLRLIQEGGWPGGPPPIGFYIDNKGVKGKARLAIDEKWQKFVEFVADLFISGKNIADTCRAANAAQHRTRSGSLWMPANLLRVFKSEHILENYVNYTYKLREVARSEGLFDFEMSDMEIEEYEEVRIPVPPLLPEAKRIKLKEALDLLAMPERRPNDMYPLSSRIFGTCGAHYVGAFRTNLGTRSYVCNGGIKGSTCPDPHLDAVAVEEAVLEELSAFLSDRESLQALAEEYAERLPGDADRWKTRRIEAQAQVDRQIDVMARLALKAVEMDWDKEVTEKATLEPKKSLAAARRHLEEIDAWLLDYDQSEEDARSLADLMQAAQSNLAALSSEQLAQLAVMFDIRVFPQDLTSFKRVGGNRCLGVEWHQKNDILVPPNPTDEEWGELEDHLNAVYPPGGRYKNVPRFNKKHHQYFNGYLHKLRTGITWGALPAEFGSGEVRKREMRKMLLDGTWQQLMEILQAERRGAPVYVQRIIPALHITGRISSDLYVSSGQGDAAIAVFAGHVPTDDPTGVVTPMSSSVGTGIGFDLHTP